MRRAGIEGVSRRRRAWTTKRDRDARPAPDLVERDFTAPGRPPKYTTTYFRHSFEVADPTQVAQLTLSLLRDDGAVVYLNGTEVFRSTMDLGSVDYLTFASSALGGSDEHTFNDKTVAPGLLVAGTNLLAVEVHQANLTSSDVSFDLRLHGELCDAGPLVLTRGPYLQSGTPSSAVVRWRTQDCAVGRVSFGTDPSALTNTIDGPNATEHEIQVTGLSPATRYYYSIGAPAQVLAGADPDYYFETAPPHGTVQQTRIWVIGDSGKANQVARDVRDDYLAYAGSSHTDVWLMLGDNAYPSGTDAEYQAGGVRHVPNAAAQRLPLAHLRQPRRCLGLLGRRARRLLRRLYPAAQ
jgi:hypothetical protein